MPVSVVDVGAVVTCGVFTDCDAKCTAMEDPTFFVRVVTYDNDIAIVPLGDTTFIMTLDDCRVFAALDDSVLISPLGDPTFGVSLDDFTNVVALSDATLIAAVL